jgi:uncharacterized protein
MSDAFSQGDFSGIVRLFPLPNLVLFPHVVQPLHIFEPRYRQMLADALEDDRRIAMALIKPGWEEDSHKQLPIYPVVCIGRIVQETRLADGRSNLLLQGLVRGRIQEELPSDKLYRLARVELLHDVPLDEPDRESSYRERLDQAISLQYADQPQTLEQLRKVMSGPAPLGALCDILAFALPLPLELKQQLLEDVDSEHRTLLLLNHLEPPRPGQRWPPTFSAN